MNSDSDSTILASYGIDAGRFVLVGGDADSLFVQSLETGASYRIGRRATKREIQHQMSQ
jgi:hypothetical protein